MPLFVFIARLSVEGDSRRRTATGSQPFGSTKGPSPACAEVVVFIRPSVVVVEVDAARGGWRFRGSLPRAKDGRGWRAA
jgi:hypothetical protein